LYFGTLRAIGKISVKNPKRFDKKMAFFGDFALFFNPVAVRNGTVRYKYTKRLLIFACDIKVKHRSPV
jgi:hypothetical protein